MGRQWQAQVFPSVRSGWDNRFYFEICWSLLKIGWLCGIIIKALMCHSPRQNQKRRKPRWLYSYNRLWKLMIDKKINKTTLRREAGITSNAMAKWVRMNLLQKTRTSSMILSVHVQKIFSGVKNVQCQQHGTVKEYADSKNKLKVTPFWVRDSSEAQHAKMTQPIGDGNQKQILYPTAEVFFPTCPPTRAHRGW